jgi:twinkle protein
LTATLDEIMGEIDKQSLTHRHDQRGYFSLAELPQRHSIAARSINPGYKDLDELWRLYPRQFTIVTGIPGHGKSTLLLNVVCNIAKLHDCRSFLYVPENEGYIRETLRAIHGEKNFDNFCANQCFIQSSEIEDHQDAPKTLLWVLERAKIAIQNDGVRLLLIDPWNELEHAKHPQTPMTDYIRECLMYMKQFCRAYDVMVVLVAHPTKAGVSDGKMPTLSDIEGSMAWFNKCDNGLIVQRDPETDHTTVVSAKVRERGAGRRGRCTLQVDPKTGRFSSLLALEDE